MWISLRIGSGFKWKITTFLSCKIKWDIYLFIERNNNCLLLGLGEICAGCTWVSTFWSKKEINWKWIIWKTQDEIHKSINVNKCTKYEEIEMDLMELANIKWVVSFTKNTKLKVFCQVNCSVCETSLFC